MKVWPWRRAAQSLVLLGTLLAPVFARYEHYLSTRALEKLEAQWTGSLPGALMAATDRLLGLGLRREDGGVAGRRPRKALMARARALYGSAWSARVLGVSLTDLLGGLESLAASRSLRWVLASSLVLPLLFTLLLGRVYCAWVCPMGLLSALAARLRRLAGFLELAPANIRAPEVAKYLVLGAGLLAALIGGLPLLHHLYPPAIVARESHSLAYALFDRAEGGAFGLPWGALSGAALFLAALVLVEAFAAPGLWCRSLCPGGAVYSLLGRWRLMRVKRSAPACVDCVLCDAACPMGLKPMTDKVGLECDNCGVCIDVCPTSALKYTVGLGLALLLLVPVGARAHHILGIPHYAYSKDFPQAPVLRLLEKVGEWEVQLTGYPGRPVPGEHAEIHVYAARPADGALYEGEMTLEAAETCALGAPALFFGPEPPIRTGNIRRWRLRYPEAANYELTLRLTAGGVPSTLRFAMVVGEPASPWVPLGGFAGGTVLLALVVRAMRIKRARRSIPVGARS